MNMSVRSCLLNVGENRYILYKYCIHLPSVKTMEKIYHGQLID